MCFFRGFSEVGFEDDFPKWDVAKWYFVGLFEEAADSKVVKGERIRHAADSKVQRVIFVSLAADSKVVGCNLQEAADSKVV